MGLNSIQLKSTNPMKVTTSKAQFGKVIKHVKIVPLPTHVIEGNDD